MLAAEQSGAAFELREITGTSFVEDTFHLRYEVWDRETELVEAVRQLKVISDFHDVHARHWAVFRGQQMVASARLCTHRLQSQVPFAEEIESLVLPGPIATMCRLVVHESARKLGLARHLDECRIRTAQDGTAKCVLVSAAPSRIAGLQSLGFRFTGLTHNAWYSTAISFHAAVLSL